MSFMIQLCMLVANSNYRLRFIFLITICFIFSDMVMDFTKRHGSVSSISALILVLQIKVCISA